LHPGYVRRCADRQWRASPGRSGQPPTPALHLAAYAALLAAVLSFGPFLVSGYGPTPIGPWQVPLSLLGSSLALLSWYGWAAAYAVASARLERDLALLAFDAALLLLLIATTGAWGLVAMAFAPVASGALMDSLVRFYLDLFANGWFVLGLIGVLASRLPGLDGRTGRVALLATCAGVLVGALAALAMRSWGGSLRGAFAGFAVAVAVMISGLLPLTLLWPAPWRGPWMLDAALWTSLAPPIAVTTVFAALALGRGRPLHRVVHKG